MSVYKSKIEEEKLYGQDETMGDFIDYFSDLRGLWTGIRGQPVYIFSILMKKD